MTDEQRLCGKHVAGTSSNRCLRSHGHSGDHSDEFEEAPGLAELRAERDQLQAHVDNALSILLRWYSAPVGTVSLGVTLTEALGELQAARFQPFPPGGAP